MYDRLAQNKFCCNSCERIVKGLAGGVFSPRLVTVLVVERALREREWLRAGIEEKASEENNVRHSATDWVDLVVFKRAARF